MFSQSSIRIIEITLDYHRISVKSSNKVWDISTLLEKRKLFQK